MAILTYAGTPAGVGELATILAGEGLTIEVPEPDGSVGVTLDLVVRVMAVAAGANQVEPIVSEILKGESSSPAVLLRVSDRQARSIRWEHDGNDCVAEVGQPLRWAKRERKTDRLGPWRTGRTVWLIEPEPTCWNVRLDISQRADAWANPLLCGDRGHVSWFDEADLPL